MYHQAPALRGLLIINLSFSLTWRRLAVWTKVRATASNLDFNNFSAATTTRLPRTVEHRREQIKVVAPRTIGVHIITQARPAGRNRLAHHRLDGSEQRRKLVVTKCLNLRGGMEARAIQTLVGINITHSRQHRLIEQCCLNRGLGVATDALNKFFSRITH